MENATMTDGVDAVYKYLSSLTNSDDWFYPFGQRNSPICHELSTSNAIYNWEIGVHMISLTMERLLANQQFELAMRVARYVFDPTVDGDTVERCWLFPPFKDPTLRTGGPFDWGTSWERRVAADEWNANRSSIHAAARGHPSAYMKRIVMKYIETLLAAGDEFFRQNTMESIPLALQRYVEASHLFGPAPVQFPRLGQKTAPKTYNQIAGSLDSFSNSQVDMELDFPFYSEPSERGGSKSTSGPMGFIRTQYFCAPPNPQILALRELIDDRIYKIRNSLDINGQLRRLPLFPPPLDPAMLMRGGAAGLSPSALLDDSNSPMPNYRFRYLIRRAYEFCSELKTMESFLLSVKERKDAESLAVMTASHRTALQNSTSR
jgi:hypothetical protein